MSHLIAFLLFGVLFIALLLLWALRARKFAGRGEVDSGALLMEGLLRPSPGLAERIFDDQDWRFVSSQTGPDIQKTFLRERRNIALSWLRQTRSQAGQLMRFHRSAVRHHVELKTSLEMKLAANYLAFLMLCGILQALIRMRGPFRAQKMAGHALGVANRLWAISEQLLAGLNAARGHKIHAAWTGKSS